ncbi:MAG TPA: hypothetical protein VFL77_11265 [Solirubrobacterales bacterium]|nr:hypothetical protein [Solirubrobacterales bacterium]
MKARGYVENLVGCFSRTRSDGSIRARKAGAAAATLEAPDGSSAPFAALLALGLALLFTLLAAAPAFAAAPVPTVEAPTEVTYTSAHLKGKINPEGGPSTTCWRFEFANKVKLEANEEGWNWANFDCLSEEDSAKTEPLPVSTDLGNLRGGTVYLVRLVAGNEEGENTSSEEEFKTKDVTAPSVTIQPVGTVGSDLTVTFAGTVNPNAPEAAPTSAEVEAGYHTNWHFECNPGCDGGGGEIAADNTAHAVEHESHLLPNKTYTLKLVAENAGGRTVEETTFETPKVAPVVSYVPSAPVSLVNDTEARLIGVIDPKESGNITDCHFIYGIGSNLNHEAPCGSQNEVQWIVIGGEEGQFTLSFEGEETGDLEFDTRPGNVQAALEGLPAIGAGNVSVKGGPGGHENGEAPYVVTFEGSLGLTNVPQLVPQNGTEPLNGGISVKTEMEGGTALEVVNAHPDRNSLVGAPVSGLAPGTEYSFRLVTTNSTETVEGDPNRFVTFNTPPSDPSSCPNDAIRIEQRATMLPDCRAWEMVSPLDKNGDSIDMEGWNAPGAADGSAVAFMSRGSFADTQGSGVIGQTAYISERGPAGWQTHAVMPTPPPNQNAVFGPITTPLFWADDLNHAVMMAYDLPKVSDDLPAAVNDYWENLRTRELTTISKPPYFEEPSPFDFWYLGTGPFAGATSADQRVIAFPMRTRLLEEAPAGSQSIYEWEEGALRLASILPDGAPAAEASVPPAPEGGPKPMISPDGSLVAFLAPKEGQNQLYVRRNHTDSVWVSEPEGSAPVTAPENVQMQYITPDSKHILFTTTSQLLNEDTNSQQDLYEYTDGPNPASENNLTLISSGEETGSSVAGVLGTSDNGGYVYYLSSTCCGGDLYLWKHGSRQLLVSELSLNGDGGVLGVSPGSRVSQDGSHLVFMSRGRRSYYEENRGLTGQIHVDSLQLYVYDDNKEMLLCASCVQSPPGAEGEVTTVTNPDETPYRVNNAAKYGDAFDDGVSYSFPRSARYLSSDGNHVYFSTPEALVPEDKNENYDVYEYDIETGQQRLISTGRGERPEVFVEASADGSTVWFATKTQVLPKDSDLLRDVYASRVGGGFIEPPPPTPCVGDGCRGPIPAAPTDPSPSTPRFSGPGNPTPQHHKKKKHHKKKHHKRHRRHGGAK